MAPEQPQVSIPKCPHCFRPLDHVGWLKSPSEDGLLITFYHNVPDCMAGLGCQLVPMQVQRRIALPNELQPRGIG